MVQKALDIGAARILFILGGHGEWWERSWYAEVHFNKHVHNDIEFVKSRGIHATRGDEVFKFNGVLPEKRDKQHFRYADDVVVMLVRAVLQTRPVEAPGGADPGRPSAGTARTH